MNRSIRDRGERLGSACLALGLGLSLLALGGCSREQRAAGNDGPTGEGASATPSTERAAQTTTPAQDPPQPAPVEVLVPTLPLEGVEPSVAALVQARIDAAREAPLDAGAWRALGEAYDAHAYFIRALTCYQRAAELAPTDVAARLAVSGLLLRLARRGEAEAHLASTVARVEGAGAGTDTVTSAGVRAELELQLGLVQLAHARLAEAAGHFEAALALDSTKEVARGNLGLVRLREGRTALGQQLLRQACAGLGPGNPALRGLLDGVLDAGLWSDAEVLVGELLLATPDDPLLLFSRGRSLAGQQRFADAARDFARVAELAPTHEAAPVNEARSYLSLGDEARAAAVLRAALERMPESRMVMQRLAWLLATASDDAVVDGALAKVLALRILGAAPKSPEYLTLAAAALAAAGEFTGAVIHEELAVEFLAGLPAELAPPRREELAAAMQARLTEYKAQRRWREPRRVVGGAK